MRDLLMMDRNEIQTPVLAIYMRHKLGYNPLELRRICKGRGSDLDHDDIADPLRVILQKFFERAQLE